MAAALAGVPLQANADVGVQLTVTQSPVPSWGLDRIDQRGMPLNNAYSYASIGFGVNAYVVGSGIRKTHQDFVGRVDPGVTFINDGRGTDDCYGSGTATAGVIGGTTYGVAKSVRLIPVRVQGCVDGGMDTTVIAGIDWVTAHHANNPWPAVATLSQTWNFHNSAMNSALQRSIASGVTWIVDSGDNFDGGAGDSCSYSPGMVRDAITVHATTIDNLNVGMTRQGDCLDLWAPGWDITSLGITSDTATAIVDDMAVAHVAGAAARLLEERPGLSPAYLGWSLKLLATPNAVGLVQPGTLNLLLAVSVPSVVVPDVEQLTCTKASAQLRAAGLKPRCVGTGTWVADQSIESGLVAPRDTTVTLTMGSGPMP